MIKAMAEWSRDNEKYLRFFPSHFIIIKLNISISLFQVLNRNNPNASGLNLHNNKGKPIDRILDPHGLRPGEDRIEAIFRDLLCIGFPDDCLWIFVHVFRVTIETHSDLAWRSLSASFSFVEVDFHG